MITIQTMRPQRSGELSYYQMKQYIRKADILLFAALVVLGLAVSAVLALSRGDAGANAKVTIESGGSLYARYSLYEDRTIVVPAPNQNRTEMASPESPDYYNTISIKDGKVSVTESSCKNQVCVKHGSISRSGESIVCLPNRLVVTIEGEAGEGGGYDTITS